MPDTIGNGGGDPYVMKFNGQIFQFKGKNGQRYNLLTSGDFRLYARIAELPKSPLVEADSYFVGVDVYLEDAAEVSLARDGTLLVSTPCFKLRVERKFCTLHTREHLKDKPVDDLLTRASIPRKGEIYVGLESGISIHSRSECAIQFNQWICSLDGLGHFGKTQDEPHPLQDIAHLNWSLEINNRNLNGATGLIVDGNRPDRVAEHYEVDG